MLRVFVAFSNLCTSPHIPFNTILSNILQSFETLQKCWVMHPTTPIQIGSLTPSNRRSPHLWQWNAKPFRLTPSAMIAMWVANSFEMMGKLLGLFSGRYLRGSQNMCMAKQLKQIEGHIAQINAPRFAEDRNMWVMMLKKMESGRQ